MDYKVSKNTVSSHSPRAFSDYSLPSPLSIPLNLNLRHLLQQPILKSLLSFNQDQGILTNNLTTAEIPLYRLKNSSKIVYRSAIALKFGQKRSLWLAELFALLTDAVNPWFLDFQFSVASSGLIDSRLSDRALGVWLQQLPQFSFPASSCQPPPSFNRFPLQYVHARCCSLLHFAHRQGLIVLEDSSSADWQWCAPVPIPFFEADTFLLNHLAERRLIAQLLATVESASKSARWSKLATLGQASLNFYRYCRIFGIAEFTPLLALARLELLARAQ